MKKPFSFDQRSKTVFCSNPKCSQVRGAEGVARMPIKKNVVDRHAPGTPLMCYDCTIFFKKNLNRHQRKAAAVRRKAKRTMVAQEEALKVMAANA